METQRSHVTLPGYLDLTFPEPPDDRPYVLVNMIMSADGKIVIEDTEQGLGSPADQRLMRVLRTHVDAVLNGAETLRKSGSTPDPGTDELRALRVARGLSPLPKGTILSRSGELPLDGRFFARRDIEGVVYLTEPVDPGLREGIEATGKTVVGVPEDGGVRAMLRSMRQDHGIHLLLCEGGAALNGALLDAGAIDEYFVTVGARLVGGNVTLTPVRSERDASREETHALRLLSSVANPDTNEVYLRYAVQN